MMQLRRSSERGHFDHGWLNTYHTFSFADYHDPRHMNFQALRVINEDVIAPGEGFPTHGHRDMEIVTYVINGALEHQDSMGNGSVIHAGDVQYMCAGTGIGHSEFNHSAEDQVHLLQIWIVPQHKNLTPGYQQLEKVGEDLAHGLKLIVSPDGAQGSIKINRDTKLFLGKMEAEGVLNYHLSPERNAWAQLVKGEISINSIKLMAGDGMSILQEKELLIKNESVDPAEFLLFDLD